MRASSVRVLAAGLAVMQAGTLVGQAPMSAYAAELEDLGTEEVENGEEELSEVEEASEEEESSEVEEASEEDESSEAEEPSEEEESTEVKEPAESEEASEAEESSEEEESSEAEKPAEAEETSEAEEPSEEEESTEVEESAEETSEAEEPTEAEETSEVEESSEAEEISEVEETSEAEESSESEESTEADETLENDLTVPEETESPANGDAPAKAPAKAPMKAPAEAKVYKITVVDVVVDEEGNELGSETRFVDELEEGEEYSYSALDDESLTVVGKAEYTGICEGDLTIEFRYTSEDLGIELFANFPKYVYVIDEFYDTDDSLIASSSRKYGYNDSYSVPDVSVMKNSDYTIEGVIVKDTDNNEYDAMNGINGYYVYSDGSINLSTLAYTGIFIQEVVFKYKAKSEAPADTVMLTVVDEFYDQDGTTLVERREREVKEVAANRPCSFRSLETHTGYYLISDGVQTSEATEDGEVVFKYAKYINISVEYKDTDGNIFYSSKDRYKYGEGYSIKPDLYRVEQNLSKFAVLQGTDIYTGTATADLTVEFIFSKPDTVTLNITYEYYDFDGGTLQYTETEQVEVEKGSTYTPEGTKYYNGLDYRSTSTDLSDIQGDMEVTLVYVNKKKYTVTAICKYYGTDGTTLIYEDNRPREFYEGTDVNVDWDAAESKYLLTSGDRALTNLQEDTEVELIFTEGYKVDYKITDNGSLNWWQTVYCLKGSSFEVPDCPSGYEWVTEYQAVDNIQQDMELVFECRQKTTEYTVTYHVRQLAADGTLESTYDEVGTCNEGGYVYAPSCPSGYEWTIEPRSVYDVQQDMEIDCECRKMCTITIIDRFLSADGKRVLYEYTRTEMCSPSQTDVRLKKPVKQGFVPRSVTDYIALVNSDMTVVNESVASDKDCTVNLVFSYGSKQYQLPSFTVKPGTLICHDDFSQLPYGEYSPTCFCTDYISYNEGDENPDVKPYNCDYYFVFDDITINSRFVNSSSSYPVAVIDRYYDKDGKVVSEVTREFLNYRAGDSITVNAISNLSGYKPREKSKTVTVTSGVNEAVLEYDECSTYTVTVKDKYYDTDGVTLLEENARPVETYNAGENVTVNSKYNNLYTCDETSKTVTDIQADTEIEFKYVKKAQYTVDITYIYYEADGVTEIERKTSQETVFAGERCYFGGSKYGFYLGLDDNFIIPDEDTRLEVPFYKYSTVKVIFHVLDSSGTQIDEVQSDLGGLKNGLQTISATSPRYTSPSTCEKEVNVVNGMEVSFDVTATPTQVTVTDYFGTIASYYTEYDYMSGQEVPNINKRGIEDTANGNILSYGDYCFIPTEAAATRNVEMNYGDSEDKLLGSHAGWKIVPQYQTSTGSSISIRTAESSYMSNSGYVFGYGYASDSPSGNKCYYIKSSSVTVTADGKTYTADDQGKIVTPDDPADKEGYEFKGWSRTEGDTDDSNKLDFSSEVFDVDTEIYPIWVAKSTSVTVTAEGTQYRTNQHGYLTSANRPSDPAGRDGYEFKGWSRTEGDTDESNKLDFGTEVFTEDTTIYPIWVVSSSTVTVTADGKTYTADENGHIRIPDDPMSKGDEYTFKGWSYIENNENIAEKIDFDIAVFTEDTTIYPIWVKDIENKHCLTIVHEYYDYNGNLKGSKINAISYIADNNYVRFISDLDNIDAIDVSDARYILRSAATAYGDKINETFNLNSTGACVIKSLTQDTKVVVKYIECAAIINIHVLDSTGADAIDVQTTRKKLSEPFEVEKTYNDYPFSRGIYIEYVGNPGTTRNLNPGSFKYSVWHSASQHRDVEFDIYYQMPLKVDIINEIYNADRSEVISRELAKTVYVEYGTEYTVTEIPENCKLYSGGSFTVKESGEYVVKYYRYATIKAGEKTYTTGSNGKISTPANPEAKPGYNFNGWSRIENDMDVTNKIDFTTEKFSSDTEIYPIWIRKASVVIVTADGRTYETNSKGRITTPKNPAAKSGYEFRGWSRTKGDTDESNKIYFSREVFNEDTEIYPIWIAVSSVVTVTADGKTYTADDQGKITTPDAPASKDGYWFKGWSRTENDTNPDNALDFSNEVFDTDTEIYPIWVKKPVVTADGKTYPVDENGKIITPDTPTDKEGYEFKGWSRTEGDTNPDNKLDFSKEVFTEDSTIYPIWVKKVVTVTADSKTYTADDDGHIRTPDKPTSKPGYIFKGWSLTEGDTDPGNALDFSKQVFTTNTEVYPIWVKAAVVTAEGKSYTADENGHIKTPDYPADKPGYVFGGWSRTEGDTNPDNKLDFDKEVFDTDTEIYPIWVDANSVVKVTADGRTYATDSKGHITTPVDPAPRPGYIFAGWSRTEGDTNPDNELDFSSEVFDTDTEVYPIWVKEYTVTAGGKDYKTDIDGHIPTPDKPDDKPGYTFAGWSRTEDDPDDTNKIDFGSEVFTEDTEVYPIWVKGVTVTADGKSYTVDSDGHIRIPDNPAAKDGYIFAGWSRVEGDTDPDNKLDFISEVFVSDTEIFPIWVKEHTVTADGKDYKTDINGHIPTPDKPTDKDGYEFKGWSRTEGDTDPGNKIDFSKEVFTSDAEIYPIWVKVDSVVTVTADGKTYTADDNGHIRTPDAPASKPGYTFRGWSLVQGDTNPDNAIDFSTKVFTANTEIYPIWVAVHSGGSSSGSSSGGSGRSSSSGRSSYQELSGSWVHLEDGRWRFKLTDGSEIIGKWAYLKNPYAVTSLGQNEVDWFRFDDQGYMVTGWYTDVDGNIYYLHPVSDGSQGHMYTGWHWIEGTDGLLRCYYFNTESDGTKGALYRSKAAPDGSIVDENGAWVVGDGAVTREAVKTASEELTVAQNSTTRSILRSVSRMFGLA